MRRRHPDGWAVARTWHTYHRLGRFQGQLDAGLCMAPMQRFVVSTIALDRYEGGCGDDAKRERFAAEERETIFQVSAK